MGRISKIEAFPLAYPEPNNANKIRHITLTRIETNDGIVGWGECISQWPEAALAVKTIVDVGFAPLLIGQDPQDPHRLWEVMRKHAFWHGQGGIVSFAISALDTSIWDLAGKIAGLPIHRLLGGKLVNEVRACASVILNTTDLESLQSEFSEYVRQGYTAIKGGWGHVPEAGFGCNEKRDLEVARAAREAIGVEVELSLDVSARAEWSDNHAEKMAKKLLEFDLAWFEDPLHHENHLGYRRIRKSVSTPIATGERCWTLEDYQRLVRSGSVDLILVDPGRVEGISGMKAVVDDAATARVKFVPHSWSSAINTAASLHVFASSFNAHIFELKPVESPMQHELVRDPFVQIDGKIEVRDTPGLGVTVDEKIVKKYALR